MEIKRISPKMKELKRKQKIIFFLKKGTNSISAQFKKKYDATTTSH